MNIPIESGANTANVKGAIDGLNPSTDPGFQLLPCVVDAPTFASCGGEPFSITLHAATFSVSFDTLPSGSTFDVAAVGEAGGAIISIDPKAGTYTASATTLTAAARVETSTTRSCHCGTTPLAPKTRCVSPFRAPESYP